MERRAGWMIAGVLLAAAFYLMPWTAHITAGFTMNGFDLAEWSSLHPAVRSNSPPMLTSFLLRVPQVALVGLLALAGQAVRYPRLRWVVWLGAVAFVFRLIPPAEFFSDARNDPNYRQMLLLCAIGIGLAAAAIPLRRLPERIQRVTAAALFAVGAAAGGVGLSRAWILLDNFEIEVTVGAGIIGFMGVSVVAGVLVLWPWSMPGENKKGG